MGIRILIADDHKIMRDGLRSLLEKQDDLEIVAEAENGRKALLLAREYNPEVAIMDISMPDMNGIEATRHLVADLPEIKVIALSMHSDKRFVVRAFQAGAAGFLLKDCAWEDLIRAIRSVVRNQNYVSPEIAGVMMGDLVNHHLNPGEPQPLSQLTGREREILQLVAEGWTTRKIAAHLYISVKTVETHRRQIMNKLEIYNVADLTKYAIREGLTFVDA